MTTFNYSREPFSHTPGYDGEFWNFPPSKIIGMFTDSPDTGPPFPEGAVVDSITVSAWQHTGDDYDTSGGGTIPERLITASIEASSTVYYTNPTTFRLPDTVAEGSIQVTATYSGIDETTGLALGDVLFNGNLKLHLVCSDNANAVSVGPYEATIEYHMPDAGLSGWVVGTHAWTAS